MVNSLQIDSIRLEASEEVQEQILKALVVSIEFPLASQKHHHRLGSERFLIASETAEGLKLFDAKLVHIKELILVDSSLCD